jgi:phosphonate transport system permease protein
VGAGGIGAELVGSLRLMRYDEVSAILIIILVMVTAIDLSGSSLRNRLK